MSNGAPHRVAHHGLRDAVEAGFERWGRFLYRRRWPAIAIVLAVSGLFASQIPKITLDMSTEGFLHPDDPTLLVYNEFRDLFDRDDRLFIAIETDDVFDLRFLSRLRDFHEELEREVPLLDEVRSLINARNTRGEGDELIVEDLLEDWPKSEAALERIEAFALQNPLYRYWLLSEDMRTTAVSLRLSTYSALEPELDLSAFDEEEEADASPEPERRYLSGKENNRVMTAVREVMARHAGPGFRMNLSGPPVFIERVGTEMARDMQTFLLLALLACGALLFLLFRRLSGTLLPLAVALLSLLTTLGSMPLLGIELEVPTQILPAFLLSVGVGDSVHILTHYFRALREGHGPEDALAAALGHSGLPVLMTSLTTAGALLSFTAAELAPVAHLGVLASIGVMLALVYSLTLLPAALAVGRVRGVSPGSQGPPASLDRLLRGCSALSSGHPWKVVAVFSLLLVIAAIGATRLRFSHDPLVWFREGDEIRLHTAFINRALRGAMTMEVLFDTGERNGLHDPGLLEKLDRIARLNEELERGGVFVGTTFSLVDIVKEINQALHENRSEFYTVPERRRLVSQELLLFEMSGSDDIEDVADPEFRVGRMTLKIPRLDALAYPGFIEMLETRYQAIVGDAARITTTGRVPLMSRIYSAVTSSMARSYLIAFVVITPLMVLLLRSVRWGLLSMIPNLTPILMTLGVMGWLGLPLDSFTILIGSIAIGLAVDDTIHLMHHFRRSYDQGASAHAAVLETLRTTGPALLFTTLVLSMGFITFTFGGMQSTSNFGFLTSFAISAAFLADVLLAPALLTLATGRERRVPRHSSATP